MDFLGTGGISRPFLKEKSRITYTQSSHVLTLAGENQAVSTKDENQVEKQ